MMGSGYQKGYKKVGCSWVLFGSAPKRYTYTKKVQKRYTLKRVPSNKGDQNGYENGTNGYRNSK